MSISLFGRRIEVKILFFILVGVLLGFSVSKISSLNYNQDKSDSLTGALIASLYTKAKALSLWGLSILEVNTTINTTESIDTGDINNIDDTERIAYDFSAEDISEDILINASSNETQTSINIDSGEEIIEETNETNEVIASSEETPINESDVSLNETSSMDETQPEPAEDDMPPELTSEQMSELENMLNGEMEEYAEFYPDSYDDSTLSDEPFDVETGDSIPLSGEFEPFDASQFETLPESAPDLMLPEFPADADESDFNNPDNPDFASGDEDMSIPQTPESDNAETQTPPDLVGRSFASTPVKSDNAMQNSDGKETFEEIESNDDKSLSIRDVIFGSNVNKPLWVYSIMITLLCTIFVVRDFSGRMSAKASADKLNPKETSSGAADLNRGKYYEGKRRYAEDVSNQPARKEFHQEKLRIDPRTINVPQSVDFYIREAKSNGVPNSSIKNNFVRSGWNEEIIDAILKRY